MGIDIEGYWEKMNHVVRRLGQIAQHHGGNMVSNRRILLSDEQQLSKDNPKKVFFENEINKLDINLLPPEIRFKVRVLKNATDEIDWNDLEQVADLQRRFNEMGEL